MAITALDPCPTVPYTPPGPPVIPWLALPQGSPLVLSNWPEYIGGPLTNRTMQQVTEINRAGTPLVGSFRVYLHHFNAAAVQIQVGIGLRAPDFAAGPVQVRPGKASRFGPGIPNPSPDSALAGAVAFTTYLESAPGEPVVVLEPGGFSAAGVWVAPGATISGYFDFQAQYAATGAPAPVEAYVMNWTADTPPSVPLPVVTTPPTSPTGPVRGVFRHRTRVLVIPQDVGSGPAQYIAAYPRGRWYTQPCCRSLGGGATNIGDYEPGWSEIDAATVYNNGNYGVDYRYLFRFFNSTPDRVNLTPRIYNRIARACTANCAVGSWCERNSFALQADRAVGYCLFGAEHSWHFATLEVDGRTPAFAPVVLNLTTTTTGGSCAPVTLWIGAD